MKFALTIYSNYLHLVVYPGEIECSKLKQSVCAEPNELRPVVDGEQPNDDVLRRLLPPETEKYKNVF